LNAASDVTVTVSVAEPPDPTERAGELNDSEKSLAEDITSINDVVWVAAPTPLKLITLVPGVALAATLIVSVADADPPDEIEIGLGLKENVTPVGTEPVADSVTGPEKLSIELPVTVTVPEPPCGIVTVPGATLRLKSG
jgi:hypothetical protein